MSTANLKDWSQDNVGKWLSSINFGYMVAKFETLRIDGPLLAVMDDTFIDTHLRLNPAEKSAFTGALQALRSNQLQQQYGTTTLPHHLHSPTQQHHQQRVNTFSSGGSGESPRPRFNSDIKKVVKVQHTQQNEPELKIASAPELLSNCRHSGWIRKQGGSRKGWRQRYMVLRMGHLYYYEKETSPRPKGYFSIQGYSVEPCKGVLKGKLWWFKLIPDNQSERTYVVSTGAEHEMRKWMQEIEDENYSYEDHVYDPVAIEEEDEFEDEDDPYEKMDPPITDPRYTDCTDDSGYVKITQGGSQTLPRSTSTPVDPTQLSPKRVSGSTLPALPVGRDTKPCPWIPPRSKESLLTPVATTTVPPPPLPIEHNEVEESPYVRLIDNGSSPTPPTNHTSLNVHHHTGSVPNNSHSPIPPRPPRRSADIPVQEQQHYTEDDIAGENPYYISLGAVDDIMPDHCLFGAINREQAVSRLTTDSKGNPKQTRAGTYLIRDSAHPDVLHVISVWTGAECKHYKLFYKEDEYKPGYSLTQGKTFPSIPMLLSHYKQEELPRSPNITLSEPYHPLDH